MLQSIRDKTHGWIAGIIISLLILSFALWGIHSYLSAGSVTDVVAKVNGSDIKQAELTVAYERLRRQYELQKANNNSIAAADVDLKKQALQSLVNVQVLRQSSFDQNYRISQTQVENFLEEMPDFKVDGQFSVARFQQMLSAALYSTKDFLELIRTNLLIDQPRLGVIFSSFSLPNEVTASIDLINQERDIQYAILPFQSTLAQPIDVSQAKILEYYNQHIDEFKKPEQVSIEYILVSAKDLMNKIQLTEQELKDYYIENVESFNLPSRWKFTSITVPVSRNASVDVVKQAETKANDIYKMAEEGKSFTAIAKVYTLSNDDVTTQDFIPINNMPTEMQNAFLSATNPGQLIKPVKTSNGFVIIKVIDYKKPEAQAFDKVKDQVKEAIVVPKSEELFANIKEKLANITYEHPETLKSAADNLNLPIQTTDLFSKDSGNQDISGQQKVREAAFSPDVLDLKNNSDVIPLNADSIVVLRVKSHSPAASIPLSEVQNRIIEKLKAKDAEERLARMADEIIAKLKTGTSVGDIAKQYHLTWNNAGMLSRHSTKIDSAILGAAFDLPMLANAKSYTAIKLPNGYAVIVLSGIQSGSLARSEDYDAFAEQVQNTQGLLEYDLYKQSVMKNAKIVIENLN